MLKILITILYDNLPYIVFALSGYILLYHNEWQLMVSAAMFYGIGCILLVSRSASHRLDPKNKRKIRHHLPEFLYEYLPYWYGATAIFLLVAFEEALMQFLAFILVILALRNLILRHNNRSKSPSKF